jgi:hypothetical protein
VWIAFIWLRIQTGDRLFEHDSEPSGFHKIRTVSWLSERTFIFSRTLLYVVS